MPGICPLINPMKVGDRVVYTARNKRLASTAETFALARDLGVLGMRLRVNRLSDLEVEVIRVA